jgi:hypothetical protein
MPEIDPQAAIQLLDRLDEPSEMRLLALAVINVVGVGAIDSIVAAASVLGAEGLAVAALVERARAEPAEALRAVAGLTTLKAREQAVAAIGRIAVVIDAAAAVAAAESIDDIVLEDAYFEPLYAQWALTDLPSLFAHLETLDPRPENVSAEFQFRPEATSFERALAIAAESDPQRVLDFGRQIGSTLGLIAETSALKVLSAQDPAAAINYLAAVPDGLRLDELTVSLATGYARSNFDAAFAWATTMQPPVTRVRNAVVQVLAETDLARAVRIEAQNPVTSSGRLVNIAVIPPWFQSRMISDFDEPAVIADQIASAEDDVGRWKASMLGIALSRWATTDPNGALAWMQNHGSDISAATVASVADAIVPQATNLDVERLIGLGGMLDARARGEWIGRVVERVASADPSLAFAVADRYRNESFYESLRSSAALMVAISAGPEEAARLIGSSVPVSAAMSIGRHWARVDPRRAAAWAVTLQDQQARESAVGVIAGGWAESDVEAATGWARGLPDSALREQAREAICNRLPETGCD